MLVRVKCMLEMFDIFLKKNKMIAKSISRLYRRPGCKKIVKNIYSLVEAHLDHPLFLFMS